MANRQYDEMHGKRPYHDGSFPDSASEWSEHYSLARPFHFRDGVTISVSAEDLTPDDDFLRQSLGPE